MAKQEKVGDLSPGLAAELYTEMSERADNHLGKAVLFFAIALAMKVWHFKFNPESMPLQFTEQERDIAIGLLGWVGVFHLQFGMMVGVQVMRLQEFLPKDLYNLQQRFSPLLAIVAFGAVAIVLFVIMSIATLSGEMVQVLEKGGASILKGFGI